MLNRDKTRIAVLVSGGGTNLQALLDAQASGALKSGEIVLVVSNNANAYALTRAEKAGVPSAVLTKKGCGGQAGFEEKLAALLEENSIDLIVLAGFMNILSGDFTGKYDRRIINVHPSLIPSFCGKNYYGLRVHEEALRRGVKMSGCTVHFANNQYDEGPIIVQKSVPVHEDDTSKSLQARVLKAEFEAYPEALRLLAANRVEVVETPYLNKDGRVIKIARIKPN